MCATPAAAAVTIQSAAYKDQLLEIANRVNAASGVRQILATLKDRIPALLGCENVTVYALDVKVQQLYTLMKAGEGIKEIRIPKNFSLGWMSSKFSAFHPTTSSGSVSAKTSWSASRGTMESRVRLKTPWTTFFPN